MLSGTEKDFAIQHPPSLVNQVTNFLTDSIIEGRLVLGERLVESDLQRRFGISRGPIRESFRMLEKDGFVVTIPRKGTYVRKITRKDIEESFPIRAYLEGLGARLALSHIQQGDIDRMELALSKMAQAAQMNDFKAYLKHHSEFHEVFILASNNDALREILQNLKRQFMWFRLLYLYVHESLENELRAHRDILDLCIRRDVDGLEYRMREHISVAMEKFLNYIASKNS